jgi:predicted TPR repeat methyltransferase
VIDLGCGTGLLGESLRPTAGRLVGVDLSPRMVEKAREWDLYDELIVGDVAEALAARPAAFDLVAAADVFVYLGDLEPVFRATAGALRPGGLFAFSVEFLDEEGAPGASGYRIGPSRRYAHSPGYVRRVAGENRFVELSLARAGLRLEKGQQVQGLVVVLRKPATIV